MRDGILTNTLAPDEAAIAARVSGSFLCLVGAGLTLGFGSMANRMFYLPLCLVIATLVAVGVHGAARPRSGLFCFGALFAASAYYWLPQTISSYGKLPLVVSALLFLGFVLYCGLQFVLCGWLFAKLNHGWLRRWRLALPFAWGVSEYFFPNLFPWCLGYGMIDVTALAGLAEYGGAFPLSMLVIWWGEGLRSVCVYAKHRSREALSVGLAVAVVTSLVLGLGAWRDRALTTEMEKAVKLRVGLVQGNEAAMDAINEKSQQELLSRYRELSDLAVKEGAEFLVWPEGVVDMWTPESLASLSGTQYDPYPGNRIPLIYGTYSERREIEAGKKAHLVRANSALALGPNGEVLDRYHKRALMPFGESIPFGSYLSWWKELNEQTGQFVPGTSHAPISFPVKGIEVRAGGLVCYEDLETTLSRASARAGANVLVNLTNDAWFGESPAGRQHYLLASWRAIESRRVLLRATNTGATGVILPNGASVATIPSFQEGYLVREIPLLTGVTLHSRAGDWPMLIVAILCMGSVFYHRRLQRLL